MDFENFEQKEEVIYTKEDDSWEVLEEENPYLEPVGDSETASNGIEEEQETSVSDLWQGNAEVERSNLIGNINDSTEGIASEIKLTDPVIEIDEPLEKLSVAFEVDQKVSKILLQRITTENKNELVIKFIRKIKKKKSSKTAMSHHKLRRKEREDMDCIINAGCAIVTGLFAFIVGYGFGVCCCYMDHNESESGNIPDSRLLLH